MRNEDLFHLAGIIENQGDIRNTKSYQIFINKQQTTERNKQ